MRIQGSGVEVVSRFVVVVVVVVVVPNGGHCGRHRRKLHLSTLDFSMLAFIRTLYVWCSCLAQRSLM